MNLRSSGPPDDFVDSAFRKLACIPYNAGIEGGAAVGNFLEAKKHNQREMNPDDVKEVIKIRGEELSSRGSKTIPAGTSIFPIKAKIVVDFRKPKPGEQPTENTAMAKHIADVVQKLEREGWEGFGGVEFEIYFWKNSYGEWLTECK